LLENKKALVTGSSRGIGFEIALKLASNGAKIIANSRNQAELEKVFEKNPNINGIAGDVTNAKEAEHIVSSALEALDNLDVVVCNVGSGRSVLPGKETVNEWHRVFSINFFSTINIIEAMKINKIKNCSVICITSICGNETIPGAPICYSNAKAALNNYVNLVSRPLAKLGIRINAVSPGNIMFDGSVWQKKMFENPRMTMETLKREVPMTKFGSPSDVANAVVWFASDLSNFVTGTILTVDGGQTRNK
jgi:3-oxoacyl-[acyl-carrier protein] reductase